MNRTGSPLTAPMREAILGNLRGYADPNTIKALRRRGLVAGGMLTEAGEKARDALLQSKARS